MTPSHDSSRPARGTPGRKGSSAFLLAVLPASCLGFSNLVLLPLWTETVAAGTGLPPEALLLVGSLELAAAGLASLGLGLFGIQRSAAALLRAGLATAFLANAAFALYLWSGGQGIATIGLARLVAGFGEGVAASTALARIGRSTNAERLLLLNQLVIGLFSMSSFAILPLLIAWAGRMGAPAMATFLWLALLALAGLLLAGFADAGDDRRQALDTMPPQPIDLQGWLGIGMIFCFLTGFTLIYSSWGRLGARIGLDVDGLASSLAIGAVAGLVALGLLAMTVRNIRLFPMIALCLLLLVCSAIASTHASLMAPAFQHAALQISICVEQVGSLIMSPLLMAVLAMRDRTGRLVAIAPLATMSASIFGTLTAALVSRYAEPTAIGWTACLLYGFGLLLLAMVWRGSSDAARKPSPSQ